jgi:twitching motility protein PilT
MSIIRDLLANAIEAGASDVHLKSDQVPFYRIHSALTESGFDVISAEEMQQIISDIIPPHIAQEFTQTSEADFSLNEPDVGRFRVNVFRSEGKPAAALRHVKMDIPTFEGLNLPSQMTTFAEVPRGIILLAGTTGSGKSTSLAAIIQRINTNMRKRIITIEDPIEYHFDDDQSVITQREVGLDTVSYQESLKRLMRQDPDVIMVGEMRDSLSISTSLQAAETGHLVLSTLHASNAALAIPRMLDVFPSAEHDRIRMAIADNLHAVACQRLVKGVQIGLVPAVEILINSPMVRKLIVKNELNLLSAAIETGRDDGMQTFNQALYDLITSGMITEESGLTLATNPESLRMNLQGIFLDEANKILSSVS